MKAITFKSDFILMFVAVIWGLAFVAQRIGMDHIGPFTFNGIRFVLGCLSLLPVVFLTRNKTSKKSTDGLIKLGTISGIFLFFGISLQQVGIVYTTAGKAGFITGLYVVIVPILNLFLKQENTTLGTWIGAIMAGIGMFLLSVTKDLTINFGDLLVLGSAFCFASHLIIIGRISNRFNTALLSLVQCLVCAGLSLLVAVVFETLFSQISCAFPFRCFMAASYPSVWRTPSRFTGKETVLPPMLPLSSALNPLLPPLADGSF